MADQKPVLKAKGDFKLSNGQTVEAYIQELLKNYATTAYVDGLITVEETTSES